MTVTSYLQQVNMKMDKAIAALKTDFSAIRTGRASPGLVENINVNYYETNTPLKQLATITTPDAKLIVIESWDKSILQEIEKAISQSDLGLSPVNDGKVIRIALPQLTSDRREELVKTARKILEEHKVSMRTIRREANDHLKKLHKDSVITEDENFHYQSDVQKNIDKHIKILEDIFATKEKEIREG